MGKTRIIMSTALAVKRAMTKLKTIYLLFANDIMLDREKRLYEIYSNALAAGQCQLILSTVQQFDQQKVN